ncbi:MAG: energy-coupling factor transporter ATPase [Anaerolineaceae bacterium]|jgi:energy-coupling factor transport system ATP-binding protein|nr:energy-coupling factor transporter ATPase [Anaerolineaceae bacterium]
MPENIVVIENVSYSYPRSEQMVLSEISLNIKKGEFFGLIGPTGAGKTTFCCALNGIVPQFYGGRFFGKIEIAGLDTLDHPISVLAKHVGQVFEDPETQLIATSVENEIAFALENLKVPREEIMRRIPRVLEAVRLEGMEKKHPAELSGGQKQRLAIAAALAAQPDVLVLDEPTSQLDPIGTQEVFSTVYELNKELNMTIFMSSHAAEEMAEYSDRIGLLSYGKLIQVDTPEKVYADIPLLLENQLRVPQVASTFYSIQKKGIKLPKIPVKLDEGKKLIRDLAVDRPLHCSIKEEDKSSSKGELLIHVNNLEHVYPDGTKALHGVSLDIHTGEYLLIIGQNGAGKSTLVRHFLNLLKPTSGELTVNGVDSKKLTVSELASHIGYIAQNPDNQIFNMTVWDEVSFALKNLKFSKEEIIRRTEENLSSMGLLEYKDRHPLALPKGDRARVVIAAILAMYPDTIIFDEPTTGQDYKGSQYILDISRKLHQMGKTVIVITHHLYLMPDYAERVIVMGKGSILLDAPIRQAYMDTEKLNSTYLTPPQAVLLAKELSQMKDEEFPLLTPSEVANCFSKNGGAL